VPTVREIRAAAEEIRRERAKHPDENPLEVDQRELRKIPEEWRPAVEDFYFLGNDAAMVTKALAEARYRLLERWGAGGTGVGFFVLLIIIALYIPDPSDFQYLIFRTVLALAAGGFAALIPGALELEWNKAIRATGAIGIAVLVYLWNPAQLAIQHHPH
jgi:hypothetical protein